MRIGLQIFGFMAVLCTGAAVAGINWISIWLEPNAPVVLTVGENQTYAVWGLNGADVRSNLTKSPYLKMSSSNPDVVEIDRRDATFIGKKPGHSVIRFSFSEASNAAQAVVKEPNSDSAVSKGR